jgi:hypothetical protein
MATIFDCTTLGISAASVITSILAAIYAREAVDEARSASQRAQQDWKQRQWVDLYREADYAYDLLDRFYNLYGGDTNPGAEYQAAFNAAIFQSRRAHAAAAVFPINEVVTNFFEATIAFSGPADPQFSERLEKIFEAVQNIREQALLDVNLLS